MNQQYQSCVEKTIAILSIIFCVFIAFLDFAGWLDGMPIIAGRVPIISLLLLSLITSYLVFSQPAQEERQYINVVNRLSEIDKDVKSIDLLGGRVEQFRDFDSCLSYINHHIKRAKIKVLSFYSDTNLSFSQVAPSNILYREILVFNANNTATFRSQVSNRLASFGHNQACAAYLISNGLSLQFFIIDSSEVVLLSSLATNNMVITNPRIVNFFQYQYDEIWNIASKLK